MHFNWNGSVKILQIWTICHDYNFCCTNQNVFSSCSSTFWSSFFVHQFDQPHQKPHQFFYWSNSIMEFLLLVQLILFVVRLEPFNWNFFDLVYFESDLTNVVAALPLPRPNTCPSFTNLKASVDNAFMALSKDIIPPQLFRNFESVF